MNARSHKMIAAAGLWLLMIAANTGASADALHLKLDEQITPASAEVIASAIARAERDHSSALIITLNTPGGLRRSMARSSRGSSPPRFPFSATVAPSGGP